MMSETDNKLTREEIHKEIDLIQSCINRMDSNSFIIKGWMITLVTALVAFLADKVSICLICLLSFIIVFCFWYLDGFFLKIERLYRKKYEWVIKMRPERNLTFLYDLNPHNKEMWIGENCKKTTIIKMMFSTMLIPFYGLPLLIIVGVIVLCLFKCI